MIIFGSNLSISHIIFRRLCVIPQENIPPKEILPVSPRPDYNNDSASIKHDLAKVPLSYIQQGCESLFGGRIGVFWSNPDPVFKIKSIQIWIRLSKYNVFIKPKLVIIRVAFSESDPVFCLKGRSGSDFFCPKGRIHFRFFLGGRIRVKPTGLRNPDIQNIVQVSQFGSRRAVGEFVPKPLNRLPHGSYIKWELRNRFAPAGE